MVYRDEGEDLQRRATVNLLSGQCAVIIRAPTAEDRPVLLLRLSFEIKKCRSIHSGKHFSATPPIET